MNNLLIIIIFVFITIIYSQYIFINKKNNSYEILQSNNPDKETFEDLINNKITVVFTSIFDDLDINKIMDDKSKKDELKQNLFKHFKYYHIPFTFTYKFRIDQEDEQSYKPIVKETSYRHLIVLLKGLKKIIIFNPEQEPNLYVKNNQSLINFWEGDKTEYPNFLKLKYIEVILKNNQMIYIPYGWWYSEYNITDTQCISSSSESVFSYILKK